MTRLIQDPAGFFRLDPIPNVNDFYADWYYSDLKGRAPDLARLEKGDERELEWLESTVWGDIREELSNRAEWYKLPRSILDIGCGGGEFLSFMREGEWPGIGVEPSAKANTRALENGIVALRSANELNDDARFGFVSLLNVLEHVPDPRQILLDIRERLVPGGVVVVEVPNDFSPLQKAVSENYGLGAYWIKEPDHINYFSPDSLNTLLSECGFDTVYEFCTFPMELFLLWGDMYLNNPETGEMCHEKRRRLEMALPTMERRFLYTKLAEMNWGRNYVAFARKL